MWNQQLKDLVSHEAKKKQHARTYSGLQDHYIELFTQMAGLIFKMLKLSCYLNYQFITDLILIITEWNQHLKDQFNLHNYL